MHFFIKRGPDECRLHPCGLLKGALRLQILNIYRASSGLRWICDHERRRNEIRKGPARSRNSTASRRVRKSYGARWICESPLIYTSEGPRAVAAQWLSYHRDPLGVRVDAERQLAGTLGYRRLPVILLTKIGKIGRLPGGPLNATRPVFHGLFTGYRCE